MVSGNGKNEPPSNRNGLLTEGPIEYYQKCLIIFAGLPLTGKTTLAKKFQEKSNCILLDVDEIRHQTGQTVRVLEQEQEKLAVESTYTKIFTQAIISGVLSRPDPYHNQLKSLVSEAKAKLIFFYLEEPTTNEIERRIQTRISSEENLSNVTSLERYLEVKGRYKLIEEVNVIRIPANLSLDEKALLVKRELQSLKVPSDEV